MEFPPSAPGKYAETLEHTDPEDGIQRTVFYGRSKNSWLAIASETVVEVEP